MGIKAIKGNDKDPATGHTLVPVRQRKQELWVTCVRCTRSVLVSFYPNPYPSDKKFPEGKRPSHNGNYGVDREGNQVWHAKLEWEELRTCMGGVKAANIACKRCIEETGNENGIGRRNFLGLSEVMFTDDVPELTKRHIYNEEAEYWRRVFDCSYYLLEGEKLYGATDMCTILDYVASISRPGSTTVQYIDEDILSTIDVESYSVIDEDIYRDCLVDKIPDDF